MIKPMMLAVSAMAMATIPTAAEAKKRHYGGNHYGYVQPYYGNPYRYGGYAPRPSYYGSRYGGYGYAQPYYGQRYYGQRYSQRYYGQRYNGRYYDRRNRCGNGTTGAIVGGAAGALIGREVTRGRDRYSYRRNSGTTGAIIGGAIGALAGREIARGC